MNYLGIDYGIKRIGIAICVNDSFIAFPYMVLENSKDVVFQIKKIVEEHDIGVIVDDIQRLFTINQKATICNNPKQALSCDDMTALYGVEAHLIHNHKHEH